MNDAVDPSKEPLNSGRNRIAWARAHMPILSGIREEFANSRPFEGLTIGICLHLEAKTAVWFETLVAGGARIVATGSPGTTQDDTLAILNENASITALGQRSETFQDHMQHCRSVLRATPDLIADNGADLHGLLATDGEFAPLKASIRGATEETTTGGYRLREDFEPFEFATWIINDTTAKRVIENRYGVGSSVVDALMRATNVMLHGKRIVIVGYGFCGSGAAQRLRGMGARVVVVDRDPMQRLEAHMEGFETQELHEAVASADMIVTITGRENVLDKAAIEKLADGCIVANAGHFATEIDTAAMADLASKTTQIRDQVAQFSFRDGRQIYLISGANLVNLAAADGNPIEVMDLGLALQSLSLAEIARAGRSLPPGAQPVRYDVETEVAKAALAAWVT